MSEKINDGGPAFPQTDAFEQGAIPNFSGMSLRDWFSGMALNGWMANPKNYLSFDPKDDAKYCYDIADTMIAERDRKAGE